MNPSTPPGRSARGGAPRFPFLQVPILRGPLSGCWWIPASGGKVLRVLLGSYEPEQTARFLECVAPGSRLIDIGAAQGYYSLLAGRLTGPDGAVLAFEPNPANAGFLQRHVDGNGLSDRVEVRRIAVGDRNGSSRFGGGAGTGTGRLDAGGAIEVQVTRLDDQDLGRVGPPTHIKIDVEGAELSVLQGARQLIAACLPTIFLSTHGQEVHRECLSLLQQWGYRCVPIIGDDVATTRESLCRPVSQG